jgi:hypothetical protein
MNNKLFWFDCDFALVHKTGQQWLDAVLSNIAQRFGCEPVKARYATDINGAKRWQDVFRIHQPTSESIFLMHGRTPGVQEALESLWESTKRKEDNLPRCRVVYSGGSEWSHLGQTPFVGSHISYCRVKPNSFKWSTAQLSSEHEISTHFAEIIENFVNESKSAEARLNDYLFFSGEQVFESTIGVAAAVIKNEQGDEACAEVLQTCWNISDAASVLMEEWPDESSEYSRLREIRNIARDEIYGKYEDPAVDLNYEELLVVLFRGSLHIRSLYQAIEEGLSKR